MPTDVDSKVYHAIQVALSFCLWRCIWSLVTVPALTVADDNNDDDDVNGGGDVVVVVDYDSWT